MALDIALIQAQWGEYYDGNNYENSIQWLMDQKGSLLDHAKPVFTAKSEWRGMLAEGDRILQACQCAWTPLGGITLSPYAIAKCCFKVDWENCPHDLLYDQFVSFWRGSGVDPVEWPFVKWIVQDYLMPQVLRDLKLYELFWGEKVAVTPGTASNPGEGMNGLSKVIQDILAAGYVSAINTGALSTTPSIFVEQVEAWYQQIPSPFRGMIEKVFMSEDLITRYKRGYQDLYGLVPCCDGKPSYNAASIYDNANVMLIGLEEMAGSDRIFASTPGNLVKLYDTPQENTEGDVINNPSAYKLESYRRMISIYTNFRLGLGFQDPRLVFTNELV